MNTTTVNFTVDALLLRELGERLVGRPEVALAELIKNAYDADASVVEVGLSDGVLSVADNGHGMSFEAFEARWMRVGTNEKEREGTSRYRKRTLTGSKGVGRLAAQILGSFQSVASRAGNPTSPDVQPGEAIRAEVDWKAAQQTGELIEAEARVSRNIPEKDLEFPDRARMGTIVKISRLASPWHQREIREVARQVWLLQPPALERRQTSFEIRLVGEFAQYAATFQEQVSAFLEAGWSARIDARIVEDTGQTCSHGFAPVPETADPTRFGWRAVRLPARDTNSKGEGTRVLELRIATEPKSEATLKRFRVEGSLLPFLEYDIRRYGSSGRQKAGVLVGDVREYLAKHGGVHVFDNGFKLGYYDRERDWLGLTADIARRYGRLELLEDLVPDSPMSRAGLNLPTTRELYGEVHIRSSLGSTGASTNAPARLMLQITRDRLLENDTYRELVALVRLGVEVYASEVERAALDRLERVLDDEKIPTTPKASAELRRLADFLPSDLKEQQIQLVSAVEKRTSATQELASRQVMLISALASAGINALATFHDFAKNAQRLKRVRAVVEATDPSREEVALALASMDSLQASLDQWKYFYQPFRDAEDREAEGRLPVHEVVKRVLPIFTNPQLNRGAKISVDVDQQLTFPPGLYPAWHAVLQNALLNALAATLSSKERKIHIVGEMKPSGRSRLEVLDTGIGINVKLSETYFKPWQQGPAATKRSIQLGLSGSGLGLFIVRTVCRTYNVSVKFVRPPSGYATCLRFEWGK